MTELGRDDTAPVRPAGNRGHRPYTRPRPRRQPVPGATKPQALPGHAVSPPGCRSCRRHSHTRRRTPGRGPRARTVGFDRPTGVTHTCPPRSPDEQFPDIQWHVGGRPRGLSISFLTSCREQRRRGAAFCSPVFLPRPRGAWGTKDRCGVAPQFGAGSHWGAAPASPPPIWPNADNGASLRRLGKLYPFSRGGRPSLWGQSPSSRPCSCACFIRKRHVAITTGRRPVPP